MKTKDCNLSRLHPKQEKVCGTCTCVEDSSETHEVFCTQKALLCMSLIWGNGVLGAASSAWPRG